MGHIYTKSAQQAMGCKIDCDKLNLQSVFAIYVDAHSSTDDAVIHVTL